MRRILIVLLLACAAWAQQPGAPTAPDLVKQGQKLNSEGKQDEALALYRRALAITPKLYEAHLESGIALDLKGDYAEARKHFAKAIEVAPADAKQQALRAMAFSYAFEGKADESAKYEKPVFDARLAAGDFAGAAGTANELARIYLESGDATKAYEWYQTGYETVNKKNDLSDADKNLWIFRWENAQARIDARSGKPEAAVPHIAAAKAALEKAKNPDQAAFFPYLVGYVAFYAGDFKNAISNLQQADQRDPFILALIGEAYEKTGERAQASEYFKKVLAINFHNPTNAFARPIARKALAGAG